MPDFHIDIFYHMESYISSEISYSFECYLYRACNWPSGPSPTLVPTLGAREDAQKSFRDFRNNSLFLFNVKPISEMISSGHFWQRSSLFTVQSKNNNKQTPDKVSAGLSNS